MTELDYFISKIKCFSSDDNLNIESARNIVKEINEFLFTTHDDIGAIYALGREYNYFSDFHKYWENNYKELLNVKIDDVQCEKVADVLHDIYVRTNGKAFKEIYDTCDLNQHEVCRVRFLTANQDFRGSRSFKELSQVYRDDPSIFDLKNIFDEPDQFVKNIGTTQLSQNDKRVSYAKNIANFILEKGLNSPFDLFQYYNKDLRKLKKAMVDCQGAGYGNKKTDMLLRDMVVLNIWINPIGFDEINVASDVNTIKVALRTGILQTDIPLVSSFLDIFGIQYSHIDDMSAQAWRMVWNKWKERYPKEVISSPCLLDYLIYSVIGKTMCKENLIQFECDKYQHKFFWHSGRNKTCQLCYKNGEKNTAHIVKRILPCDSNDAIAYIKETNFYKSNVCSPNISNCPFYSICNTYNKKYLQPPKSISIEGATGWSTAYTDKNSGGGGLMS